MASIVYVTEYCNYFFIWVISILMLRLIIKTITKSNKTRPPPSPPALPFIGHLHLLSSTLPQSLETQASRYGPLMQIRMGDATFAIVSDAQTAEKILKIHDIDFASKYESGPAHYLMYKRSSFINGSCDSYWRFMKKLCLTKLFAGSQLDRFTHIREQETISLLKTLMQRAIEGESIDLSTELGELTNNMIFKMAMGNRCSGNPDEAREMRKLICNIMESGKRFHVMEVYGPLKKLDLFGNGKRIKSAFRRFDQRLEQIIKDYEGNRMKVAENEEKDVMDILLETYEDTNAEVKLTKEHIKYFFMEIFMAAVDTTATAMQSAMAELINRPKIFLRVREEINSVVGSNRLVQESDVPNLHYLQAVLKETLRLHPPGPLLRRKCTIDSKINGYDIKAGTKMFINAYTIMRDPNIWKEPDKFLPERFLVTPTENPSSLLMDFKGQNFNYLPFGSGRRACLGTSHASLVMHATVGALVQCFDWKLKGGDKADIEVVTGYTGAMAHTLVCYPIIHFDPFKT